jgi:hypothetical protein
MLAPDGVATIEFPHVLQLIRQNFFDTIYHEHFSYLSLHSTRAILSAAGLEVFDIDELPTHGGSLRVYARRLDGVTRSCSQKVGDFLELEKMAGLLDPEIYLSFPKRVEKVKNDLLSFLLQMKKEGRSIAAYGAAAKGNTLLNYAGVRKDLLPFIVDRSPGKVGTFMPGSRIPILEEQALREVRPERILILPWNLRDEVSEQLAYTREWGAQLAVSLPKFEIF